MDAPNWNEILYPDWLLLEQCMVPSWDTYMIPKEYPGP